MSHKKKHNKLLRSRKKRQRDRLKRVSSSSTSSERRLANYEYLDPYMDTLIEEFVPEDLSLYRWAHFPLVKDDYLPQIFQEKNPNSPDTLKKPALGAPKEVIIDYIDNFTFSCYLTIEDAKQEWRNQLEWRMGRAKESKRENIKENFIENKGQYIIKIDYTKEVARIGLQDDDAHKIALLYDGVDFADLIDKSFTPIKIELKSCN